MKRILISLLFISSAIVGFGQTNLIDTTYVNNKFWVTGVREELPAWLSKMSEDANTVVSFSDIGVKPEIGREQAIQRGVFTYALRQGVDVRAVHEKYEAAKSAETMATDDEIFCKLSTVGALYLLNRAYSYEVVKETQTTFGEVVLLMHVGEVGKYDSSISFSSTVELMEQVLEDRFEVEYQNFTCTFETSSVGFKLRKTQLCSAFKNGESIEVISIINGDTLSLPRKETLYEKCSVTAASSSKCYMSHLNKGYWNAFLGTLIHATIDGISTSDKGVLKQAEESYQANLQGLIRQILKDSWSMTPYIIGALDQNHIMVEWQVAN